MTDLETIEAAISHLSPQDLEKFRLWFEEHIATLWDERIQKDIEAGGLDDLATAALRDHVAGRTKERKRPARHAGRSFSAMDGCVRADQAASFLAC